MSFLAVHVKALRKNAGITQKQLADRVGVGVTTINNVESGYLTAPDIKLVDAIAAAFNTDSDSLLNRISVNVGERAKMVHVVSSVSSKNPFVEIDKIVETAFIDGDSMPGSEYMGIKMPDNAMLEEAIKPGANVIVRLDAMVKNGDIIAAVYDGKDAVIRTYYRKDNIVLLKAANSNGFYPDIEIDTGKQDFRIVGKVVNWTNFLK